MSDWNAAIEAAHKLVDETAGGNGYLWEPLDEDDELTAGVVLDRLPNAIFALRRDADPLAAAERAVLEAADEWERDGRRYISPLGRATRYWRRIRAAANDRAPDSALPNAGGMCKGSEP